MEDIKKDEELQTRREFFKRAAKKTLPILAATALGGALLTSCEELGCGGYCSGLCSGTCKSSCSGSSTRY